MPPVSEQTNEQKLSTLVEKIPTMAERAGYDASREAARIALSTGTPEAYRSLVQLASRFPRSAGMIHTRLSEKPELEFYKECVAKDAGTYLQAMKIESQNDFKLPGEDLNAIKNVAIIYPKFALEVLSGFRYLDEGIDEGKVVNEMINIFKDYLRPKEALSKANGLGDVLNRGSKEAIVKVAEYLVQNTLYHSAPIVSQTLEALAMLPATTQSEEGSICRLIRTVAANQDQPEDGLAALNARRSKVAYEMMVAIVQGVDRDQRHFYQKPQTQLALPAINLIINDEHRKEISASLLAIQEIAAIHPEKCDPVARDFFMKEGTAKALSYIPLLRNTDPEAQAFLEKDGEKTAIAVWNKQAQNGTCSVGQQLRGLLTLRFNVAQSCQENLQPYNHAIQAAADNMCDALVVQVDKRSSKGFDKAMNTHVFGKGKTEPVNGVSPDWVETLKAAFVEVATQTGYDRPSALLEVAVKTIEAKEKAEQLAAEMLASHALLGRRHG